MKKKSIAFLVTAAVFFCGCSASPDESAFTEAPIFETESAALTEAETGETVSKNEEKEPPEIVSLPAPENKEHPPVPESEVSVTEFTGIPLSENLGESFNLNSKDWGYHPICFDSGKVYFSNPKDRQYLYVYDGEESNCLAELPANALNFYDNKIYFISNGNMINPSDYIDFEGFLFSYDLESEELTRLTDFYITQPLYVSSEGIFYFHISEETKGTIYKLDEGFDEITPLYNSFCILNYNGFHYNVVTSDSDGLTYLCLSDGENNYVLNEASDATGYPRDECIANGKFYFRRQGMRSLTSIDLKDGTVFEFPVNPKFPFSDYTVFSGTEYVARQDGLCEFKDGRFVKYEKKEPLVTIERLYSGSDSIYALIEGMDGPNDWDLAEIVFSTDEEGNPAYGFNRIT